LNTHTIILAGGKGARMLSQKAKVLQKLGGKTMLNHLLQKAKQISSKISVVVGFDKDGVENEISNLSVNAKIFMQKEQLGTADAVKTTLNQIEVGEKVLVLYGDVPLVKKSTLEDLCSTKSDITILTTKLENPTGYGRVVKDENDFATSIIEEKDATELQKEIKETFTGILAARGSILKELIPKIDNNKSAKEFYLTDLISK
jgi:N-acetylglucosamine-1-phosphate uridyltransferase (contains nucleotidyltransferase and I-patch acetyltransferase domains)